MLKIKKLQQNYTSAQPFTTPAGGALPARSGSGEMSKLKQRAQPRSVTWKGKKLSNRSTPASTHASTSSGRPTPCSSLRVTRKHTVNKHRQKQRTAVINKKWTNQKYVTQTNLYKISLLDEKQTQTPAAFCLPLTTCAPLCVCAFALPGRPVNWLPLTPCLQASRSSPI